MSRGRRLWVGLIDKNPAIIRFTCAGNKVNDFYFPLTSDCLLNYYTFTFLQYRGRGIMSQMILSCAYKSKEDGFERLYACVDDYNASPISVIEKVGFKYIGYAKTKKRTGKKIWYPKNLDL